MIASVFLFVGMGINYRLLDQERKAEEKREREEPKEERAAMLAPPLDENNPTAGVTLDDVARVDEDTV